MVHFMNAPKRHVARNTMSSPHTEMHQRFDRINSMWAGTSRVITYDDRRAGWVAEVIRWRREKLGGRDQDLCGPEQWQDACKGQWSVEATYRFLGVKSDTTWLSYVHDTAHDVYTMLPLARGEARNYDNHSPQQAALELELAELVVGWLRDEARGVKHAFAPLSLSRPGS